MRKKLFIYSTKYPGTISVFSMLIALFISSCGNGDKPRLGGDEKLDKPPVVQVAPLQKGILSSSLHIPGELAAFQQVDLYAKVSSYVKKVYVDVGSEVHQGDLLVSLDAPEINSQITEAQSRLNAQQAVCQASKASYDRLYETSKTPGTVSGNDLDQALARKNSDQAQLEAAKSAYQAVVENKAYLNIKAPFNAVVSARSVNPGAFVGPVGKGSDQPLFVLQEQKHLRLIIAVPEAYSGILKQNEKVNFTVRSMPGHQFTAAITRLAGALDTKLRSERLEMDVNNNDKTLLPGMYAEVSLNLRGKDSTLIIPKTALVQSTEKVFVIRIVDHKADWVDVKKGREANGQVEVFGKLNPGDEIVQNATDEIRNGQPVNIRK